MHGSTSRSTPYSPRSCRLSGQTSSAARPSSASRRVSPDGERVVYTRRTVAGDRYQMSLWLVPYRGGRPRRLTHGRWSDTAPAWSPDGRTIAFLSDRGTAAKPDDDTGAELYLIDPDGGEAERVCRAPHGSVGAPLWSPDGHTIAFVSSGEEVRFWTGDPKKHVARVIRTTDWQDDSGTNDRRSHLFVVAARPGARPRAGDEGRLRRLAAVVAPVGEAARLHVDPRARCRHPPEDPPVRGGGSRGEAQGAGRAPRLRRAAGLVARRPPARRSSAPTSPARPTTRSPPCGCARARTSAA